MKNKLIEMTSENLEEAKSKIDEFIKRGAFLQTHDWIHSPRGTIKTYDKLDFNYDNTTFQSATTSLDNDTIKLTAQGSICELCNEPCLQCDDTIAVIYVGDEIEFGDNYINVVSYGYGRGFDVIVDSTVVVWRLYRNEEN